MNKPIQIGKSRKWGTSRGWVNLWDSEDFDVLTGGEPMKNTTAAEFLAELYRTGVVYPVADPFSDIDPYELVWEGRENVNPQTLQAIDDMFVKPRVEFQVDWDQLALTPEVIQYQENGNTWDSPGGSGFQYSGWEIARFIVPPQQVGIVRSIETGVTLIDNNLRWPRGDSRWLTRFEVDVRWHLKVEQYNIKNPQSPYEYRGNVKSEDLPGSPYPPLPVWKEMRFMWGQHNPIFLVLPENTFLSLWIEFLNGSCDTIIRDVSGRFQGMTQAQGSQRTFRNVTTGW